MGGSAVGLWPPAKVLGHRPALTGPRPLCSAFQNMPNVRDHDASVYLRLQGDALSVGGYEANPIFWEEVRDRGIEGGHLGCVWVWRSLPPESLRVLRCTVRNVRAPHPQESNPFSP